MTFLARLFGRKPKPPVDRRGWSEDWQVGDVALCISDMWHLQFADDPKRGDVLRVCGLVEGLNTTGKAIISALQFEGKPANHAWAEKMFQKIRPAEQCFTEAMRNLLRQPVTPTGPFTLDRDGEGATGHDARCVNAGRSAGGVIIPANCASVAIFPVHHGE